MTIETAQERRLSAKPEPVSDPRSSAGRPNAPEDLLGQVLTPNWLARTMAEGLLGSRSDRPLRLVDPCVGPGTFPLALAATDRLFESDRLVCIDVDPEMTAQARRAQSGIGARIEYLTTDYLKWQADQAFDGAILNPPYIRQEWITDKAELRQSLSAGMSSVIPGTANLYVYFLVKALSDLRPGGRLVAVVYDGWRQARYGQWLYEHLQRDCEEVAIKPVANTPFHGRLIDATVITAVKGSNASTVKKVRRRDVTPSRDPLSGIPGLAPVTERSPTPIEVCGSNRRASSSARDQRRRS